MNPLTLERPLVIFDIESTGTDVCLDRIISLAATRLTPADLLRAGSVEERDWLVNPCRA